MSEPHLTTGSQRPPKIEGKLRLYSMEYCPYAQRSRLVLKAKNIPHDIVNINLINKPDWYFEIHPEGKVPALDTGSEIIVESLVIADKMDAQYSENPLYPSDPKARQADQELIKQIDPLTSKFYDSVLNAKTKPVEAWVKELIPFLEVFELALQSRGTTFFRGDKPGMVDYMLWPWAERAGILTIAHGQKLPFREDQIPLLRKWRQAMRADPICSEMYHPPEKHWKTVQIKLKQIAADYDSI